MEKGSRVIAELRDPSRVDSDGVQCKRKAAEMWCKQRGMEYVVVTIG